MYLIGSNTKTRSYSESRKKPNYKPKNELLSKKESCFVCFRLKPLVAKSIKKSQLIQSTVKYGQVIEYSPTPLFMRDSHQQYLASSVSLDYPGSLQLHRQLSSARDLFDKCCSSRSGSTCRRRVSAVLGHWQLKCTPWQWCQLRHCSNSPSKMV